MQRHAARLLPEQRVKNCLWSVQRNDQPVEVLRYETGKAGYAGLQTCGSVWSCPVCSRKISETRREELNLLLAGARQRKYAVVMVTLTASHTVKDDLKEQLERLKAAKRRMRQRRDWREFKTVLVGSVTATEATYGGSGWHTHFHEIFVVDAPQDQAEAMLSGFSGAWLTALEGQGLTGQMPYAYQVQGASEAGSYVGKWGAAEEIALGAQKHARGQGRTPFQLLHDATVEGDEQAGSLFRHFAQTFKGARQLVWSNGLKDAFGIDDVSDDEAAEAKPEAEIVGLVDKDTWRGCRISGRIGARHRRGKILDAAETRDSLRLQSTIAGVHGLVDETIEHIVLIEDPPDPSPDG